MKKIIVYSLFLCFFLVFPSFGQSLKGVLKTLDKKDFPKVRKSLDKILLKDSLDAGATYIYTLYFSQKENSAYNIDSAHFFLLETFEDFKKSDEKAMNRWSKANITPPYLKKQRIRIDSLAFGIADSLYTVPSFQHFLDLYTTASQTGLAISKRDSIAYKIALAKNTHHALKEFYDTYPEAIHVMEAKERYEILAFEQKTEDGTIESFETFLKEHPKSPFLDEATTSLYYLYTKNYDPKSFADYLEKHPTAILAHKSWVWLWHLADDKKAFLEKFPNYPKKQHAKSYIETLPITYFTFIEKEKFGFMDSTATVKIMPQFEAVTEEYLCESISDKILIIKENGKEIAIDKTGKKLNKADFDKIEYFAKGVLKVWKGAKVGLLEMNGELIIDCKYTDLQSIKHNLVIAQKGTLYGIISYNENTVLGFQYDEILLEKNGLIALKKDEKYTFTNLKKLFSNFAESGDVSFSFDKYEFTHNGFLKVSDGESTRIQDLEENILFETSGKLSENQHGWLLEENKKFQVLNNIGDKVLDKFYNQIKMNSKGYAVKSDSLWGMLDFQGKTIIEPQYSALHFLSDKGVLLEKEEKKFGFFYADTLLDFSEYQELEVKLATFQDSIHQVFIITKNKKGRLGMLSETGEKLLDNIYYGISFLNDSMISIKNSSGRKGLYTLSKEKLLPIKYDAFAPSQKGCVATMKNKKFGIYDKNRKQEIPAQYDALLKHYGNSDTIFIAKKGKYGIIDSNNKTIADFQFDKINAWNDSTLLVEHQSKWKLYDFKNRYFLETFEAFDYLENTSKEIVIITHRSSGSGLLSNKKGRLISEEYSEIYNLNDNENPFYVAEKHIPEADLFIILYVNENGEVVKKLTLSKKEHKALSCQD